MTNQTYSNEAPFTIWKGCSVPMLLGVKIGNYTVIATKPGAVLLLWK